MLDYTSMSTATLSKMATAELRELAKLGDPKKVHPSKRETFRMEHEGKLHQLAGYLYQHETITGKEFMDILERQELPEAEA